MSTGGASDATIAARRPKLIAAVKRRRKSEVMSEYWRRRRAELNEFIEDEPGTESVGCDRELDELPEVV